MDNLPKLTDEQLKKIESTLDERQREIIFRRIGFGYHKIQSLAYIAKDFKISRERVRQIQNESLLKINDPAVTHMVLLAETKATYERSEKRRERLRSTLSWRSSEITASKMEEQKSKHDAAYKSWTADEDKALWDAFLSGASSRDLAKEHARSIGAIRSRIKKIREGVVVLQSGLPAEEVKKSLPPNRRFKMPGRGSPTQIENRSIDPHPSEYGTVTIRPVGKPEALLPGNEVCPSCGVRVTGNRMNCRCS